jgi:hypothetical protein
MPSAFRRPYNRAMFFMFYPEHISSTADAILAKYGLAGSCNKRK